VFIVLVLIIGALAIVSVLMIVAVIIGNNGTGLDQELPQELPERPGPAAVNRPTAVGSHLDGGF
jgi:hypothetical protein